MEALYQDMMNQVMHDFWVPSPSGTYVLGAIEIAKQKLQEAIQHLQDDNGQPNPNLDNKRDVLVECMSTLERALSSVPVWQDMVDGFHPLTLIHE
ncbi:hypothetical protein AZE42_11448 [Rhizopogon vesiculosus]|uniref:Uncharacterized protein n=1 Tax=Rhizopogon vesiculosus TaxID=180088 RepID=A0A1J8QVX4_9AGAM|nr:hypothetical protein AZE42_11448 [Rhizopogon vesiculosus]